MISLILFSSSDESKSALALRTLDRQSFLNLLAFSQSSCNLDFFAFLNTASFSLIISSSSCDIKGFLYFFYFKHF